MHRNINITIGSIPEIGGGGVNRLGLHITEEELTIWNDRWDNGVADSFINGRITTEKTAVQSARDTFTSDPNAQIWTIPDQGTTSCATEASVGSSSANRDKAITTQRAAFHALLHEDATVMAQVRDQLVLQPDQVSMDFTLSPPWCGDSGSMRSSASPGFALAHIMVSQLHTYNYIKIAVGKGLISDWSTADDTKLKDWFLGFADYCHQTPLTRMNENFIDYWPDGYTFEGRAASGELYTSTAHAPDTYDGGPQVGSFHNFWNNRMNSCMRFVGLAGIIFDGYGDATFYKAFAKRWFGDFIRYAVYPQGASSDTHRDDSLRGLGYPMRQFAHAMHFVDTLARTGDTSLYDLQTTDGNFDTDGAPTSPNPETDKSYEFVALWNYRYAEPTFYGRTYLTATMAWDALDSGHGVNRGRNDQLLLGNLYWQRSEIEEFYRGESHPFNIDSAHQNNNDSGTIPAPYLMFGGLEGVSYPYPAGD